MPKDIITKSAKNTLSLMGITYITITIIITSHSIYTDDIKLGHITQPYGELQKSSKDLKKQITSQ